jgi:hypothetical protein
VRPIQLVPTVISAVECYLSGQLPQELRLLDSKARSRFHATSIPIRTERPFFLSAAGLSVVGDQTPFTSPPSMRTELPVIHFAAGETIKANNSAISSGCP